MAVQVLAELINKTDTFELVRDQIGAIILANSINQVALATAALEPNPKLWELRVFTEAGNPWEEFINWKPGDAYPSPLVNVWFDSSDYNQGSGNINEKQRSETTYNIDIYGFGYSKNDPAGGHILGDQQAAFNCHRGIRWVRNILMSSQNTYLQMQGVVGKRWPQSITTFQPSIDSQQVQQIVAARFALRVDFSEYSPQTTPTTLDELAIEVNRHETGELYFNYELEFAP